MPPKFETLSILVLLLPGFLCAFIVQIVAVRGKQTEFEKVIEALLFSAILYLCIAPFFHYTLPVRLIEQQTKESIGYAFQLNWPYLFLLVPCGGFISLLYGTAINQDWVHKLLRSCKLTEKTSRLSVWNDTLQDIKSTYILVELGDGRRVVGYLRYYSDDVEQASVFLEDAAWLLDDGQQRSIDGPGILLTKEAAIISISFLEPEVKETTESPEAR